MAIEVQTSLKIIMQRSMTKLLSCLLIKLKANMQSIKALDKNTKLSKIVIERIRMSRPSSWEAIDDLRLIE